MSEAAITVDLGRVCVVSRVDVYRATSPHSGQYVTGFRLYFSQDGVAQWANTDYQDITTEADNQPQVVQLSHPAVARYLRLKVTSYHGHPSLRWQVYGMCPSGCPPITGDLVTMSASSQY